jgi:hypothetical protein
MSCTARSQRSSRGGNPRSVQSGHGDSDTVAGRLGVDARSCSCGKNSGDTSPPPWPRQQQRVPPQTSRQHPPRCQRLRQSLQRRRPSRRSRRRPTSSSPVTTNRSRPSRRRGYAPSGPPETQQLCPFPGQPVATVAYGSSAGTCSRGYWVVRWRGINGTVKATSPVTSTTPGWLLLTCHLSVPGRAAISPAASARKPCPTPTPTLITLR